MFHYCTINDYVLSENIKYLPVGGGAEAWRIDMDSPTCFRSIYCIDGCAEATRKATVTSCAEPPSTDGPANEPLKIQVCMFRSLKLS